MFKIIVGKLFPPQEVRNTVRHIKHFLRDNASFSRSIIQTSAINLAKQTEKTVNFIKNDNHEPEHLALLLITNVIAKKIVKREYTLGSGLVARDMLKVWEIATRRMRDKYYYSEEEYQKDCAWIARKGRHYLSNIV